MRTGFCSKQHQPKHACSQIDLHIDFETEVQPFLGRLIGVGGFGRVYEAKWHGRCVAVKIMPCDNDLHYTVRG